MARAFFSPQSRGRGPTVDWPRESQSCPILLYSPLSRRSPPLPMEPVGGSQGGEDRSVLVPISVCARECPSTPEGTEGLGTPILESLVVHGCGGEGPKPNSSSRNCALYRPSAQTLRLLRGTAMQVGRRSAGGARGLRIREQLCRHAGIRVRRTRLKHRD